MVSSSYIRSTKLDGSFKEHPLGDLSREGNLKRESQGLLLLIGFLMDCM
jgi:hypothetical protein